MSSSTPDRGIPDQPHEMIAQAVEAAEKLNAVLRAAAEKGVKLEITIERETPRISESGEPAPEISVVEVVRGRHQEGRRPEDLHSANDD